MLETIRDDNGNLQAVIEYYVVDNQGNLCDEGKFIWINQIEISNSVNGHSFGLLKEFAKRIITTYPQAQFAYFKRKKYNGRIRIYSKREWLKIFKED